jgi:hypothetical protein
MKQSKYKTYDELPLMLSVPEVAAVLGISRAGRMSSRGAEAFLPNDRHQNCVPKDKFHRLGRAESFRKFFGYSVAFRTALWYVYVLEKEVILWQKDAQTARAASGSARTGAGRPLHSGL